MAGYQFAHMQTYSRKGNKANRSSTDILLENSRAPGNHPHVENAELPNLIHGIDPADVVERIEERVEQAKARLRNSGKRIQVNTHVLNGAVFSHPLKTDQLKIADDATRKGYLKWRQLACEFAIKDAERMGMEVLSIVEHTDETYPHIHVLSIPKLTDDNPRFDAKQCHVGHLAGKLAYDTTLTQSQQQGVSAANAKKSATNAQTSAFKQAMREWQDRYYNEVGVKCGMARLGPQRSRMSRSEWRKTQKLSEQLVSLEHSLQLSKQELSQYKEAIDEIERLYDENDRLKLDVEKAENNNATLKAENDSLKRILSDLKVKHEQDLKVMRENANKEISRLQSELDRYAPRLKR